MIGTEQVKKAIKEHTITSLDGSQCTVLEIGFGDTPRCAADTIYLFGLERAGAIQFLSKEDRDAMAMVAHTLRWEAGGMSSDPKAERPLLLGLGQNFNAEVFTSRLGKAVDSVTGIF